jgi:hypothetical protein
MCFWSYRTLEPCNIFKRGLLFWRANGELSRSADRPKSNINLHESDRGLPTGRSGPAGSRVCFASERRISVARFRPFELGAGRPFESDAGRADHPTLRTGSSGTCFHRRSRPRHGHEPQRSAERGADRLAERAPDRSAATLGEMMPDDGIRPRDNRATQSRTAIAARIAPRALTSKLLRSRKPRRHLAQNSVTQVNIRRSSLLSAQRRRSDHRQTQRSVAPPLADLVGFENQKTTARQRWLRVPDLNLRNVDSV